LLLSSSSSLVGADRIIARLTATICWSGRGEAEGIVALEQTGAERGRPAAYLGQHGINGKDVEVAVHGHPADTQDSDQLIHSDGSLGVDPIADE